MAGRTDTKHGGGAAAVALAVALAVVLAACGSGGDGSAATRDTVPPNVVPERASAWTSITVTSADGRRAEVPTTMFSKASPLLTGRLFDSPEPLASYGLDAPAATIEYRGTGRVRTISVGKVNFDGHGYYVQRKGDPRVFLVPADQLQPLLDLVR
jgi:hypothetical protein